MLWISDYIVINNVGFEKRYFCSISQIVYASVYGVIPYNKAIVSQEFKDRIKQIYPERYLCMVAFKKKYPHGAKYLSLV